MNISKALAELREELERINAAILSLEQLESGGRRRGRPPGSKKTGGEPQTAAKGPGRAKLEESA